jgi:SAM-dependent MidA family methyltransferase
MIVSPLELAESNPALCQAIAQRISASPQRRISFAEFMEMALYHPQYGYYVAHPQGIQNDFFTSPHLGADFGELLAEQFVQMWQICNCPCPFTLVEMGAGQGLVVQDVLRYIHRHHDAFFEAIEYIIIEKSPGLIAEQQRRLQPLVEAWGRLRWCTWEEIASQSLVGCCFSNELVDAFPVHQIEIAAAKLHEVYVTLRDNVQLTDTQATGTQATGAQFIEILAEPSTPQLAEYFDDMGLDLASARFSDGYRSEVNLAALDWLTTVADRLRMGYLLTIDYGYSAERYYSPTRNQGTLQCYYQHAHHSNPYVAIGRQDITAHVNFTALERQGERQGLQSLGFTQQGLFLMALGLGDRIAALSQPDSEQSVQEILRRREVLHALLNPMGLGNFGVLIQAKGLSAGQLQQPLKGLTAPPL